ncbi:MAG: CehA/McbA family metallohydrolase [Planctomycetota bacterium]
MATVDHTDAVALRAHLEVLRHALEHLGRPLSEADAQAMDAATAGAAGAALATAQEVLDPLCLACVDLRSASSLDLTAGPAARILRQSGWTPFLIKVINHIGHTGPLAADIPEARPVRGSRPFEVAHRWLDFQMVNEPLLRPTLSGAKLEYRIALLYSRDPGARPATLAFATGEAADGAKPSPSLLCQFDCEPATPVALQLHDSEGRPVTASLVVRDALGRVFPPPGRRRAPDLWFQPQIYCADGESLLLAQGSYRIDVSRGPEYLPQRIDLEVGAAPLEMSARLERWIDPASSGWWSGDHHLHAAGGSHFERPTAGVRPADMIRYTLGEDLKVGGVLGWGPHLNQQTQLFGTGVDEVSAPPYVLTYGVEVAGFGSAQTGHLCLLGLREHLYSGPSGARGWPTLGLSILRWAKAQGGVCGTAHSGIGLGVGSAQLPNFEIPPFDGIGALDYVVNVTHEVADSAGHPVPAVDFYATCSTPAIDELNLWYHALNCGFRTRIAGESDFPCIDDSRVGVGRSYVKLGGPLDDDAWRDGLAAGRSYVSDGRSHLLGFAIDGCAVGEGNGELHLRAAGSVTARVDVAARLDEAPRRDLAGRVNPRYGDRPHWHLERARLGSSRRVRVELVVNGEAVDHREIVADGRVQPLEFEVPVALSSWVAVRILPSSHTNPIFVMVADKPVRSSRRSARWCLRAAEQYWSRNQRLIAESEREPAQAAFEHAVEVYRQRLAESERE